MRALLFVRIGQLRLCYVLGSLRSESQIHEGPQFKKTNAVFWDAITLEGCDKSKRPIFGVWFEMRLSGAVLTSPPVPLGMVDQAPGSIPFEFQLSSRLG